MSEVMCFKGVDMTVVPVVLVVRDTQISTARRGGAAYIQNPSIANEEVVTTKPPPLK